MRLSERLKVSDRTVKVILILLAAVLTFGGPTYMIYVLERLGAPHLLYVLLGLAAFTAGVLLFMRLIEEEQLS